MKYFSIFMPVIHADQLFVIDDLITKKGSFKLNLSMTYASSVHSGVDADAPIMLQTGESSFVVLPTRIGENQSNIDIVVVTPGFHYGVTSNIEVYTRAGYLYESRRSSGVSGENSNNEGRFQDAWAGFNYQIKEDNATPAVIGFMELAFYEKLRENSASFKSWVLGLTTYRAVDPVVLSLTGLFSFKLSRKDGDYRYDPGNMILLNPSMAFAINDRVTFTPGFQWSNRWTDRRNGETVGFRRTNMDLVFGLGYSLANDSTMRVTLKINASGSEGADLRLNLLHSF